MSTARERITLTLPDERRLIGVVRRFVGGVATRADLGYETIDDLQLAVESVLRTRPQPAGDTITIEALLEDRALSVRVGPFGADPLLPDESHPETLELEQLLSALVAGA